MAYSDFTLDTVQSTFGLAIAPGDLTPHVQPYSVPGWLRDALARGEALAFISEKSRSEFIVVPVLLAVREMSQGQINIYSGQRLDVAPQLNLVGECDFILALTPPIPVLQAPIAAVVEAKKNDIESGLGQCAAQMVGAQMFNQQRGAGIATVLGCVTTGETWQFLKLEDRRLTLDSQRYYINDLHTLLGVFHTLITEFITASQAA